MTIRYYSFHGINCIIECLQLSKDCLLVLTRSRGRGGGGGGGGKDQTQRMALWITNLAKKMLTGHLLANLLKDFRPLIGC